MDRATATAAAAAAAAARDHLLDTPTSSRASSLDISTFSSASGVATPYDAAAALESTAMINPWEQVDGSGSETPSNVVHRLSTYGSSSTPQMNVYNDIGTSEDQSLSPYDHTSTAATTSTSAIASGRSLSRASSVPYTPPVDHRFSLDSNLTAKDIGSESARRRSTTTFWDADGTGRRAGYENLTAIDWIHEYHKERQRKQKYEKLPLFRRWYRQLADSGQVWFVLFATGISAGLLAAGIDIVANWLGDIKSGRCKSAFYLTHDFCCLGMDESDTCDDWATWGETLHATGALSYGINYFFYILFAGIFGTASAFLVLYFAPFASHSGIPEIKTVLGGFIIKGFMGFRTVVTKSVSLCFASASGMWLGKEGPLVHVACCCANLVGKASSVVRQNEAVKREIFSAAAAAGITVAFGSPVGGVLFSLEQLSYYFPDKTLWQSFVCAMVASVTIQFVNPYRTGKLVLFQVVSTRLFHHFELIPFLALGIIGGIYGGLFIRFNMRVARWRANSMLFSHPLAEVAFLAVASAVVNFPDPFSRLQNNVLVFDLFRECDDSQRASTSAVTALLCSNEVSNKSVLIMLTLVCVIGFIFTGLTFGTNVPSGVLMPSMAIGACYGRIVGIGVQALQARFSHWAVFAACAPGAADDNGVPCVTLAVYSIVGAASALGGVTRLTASLVVIMFELTGALIYVLPIMLSVLVSKWVGDAIERRGIYESWILFRGYPYLENEDEVVEDMPVSDIMKRVEDLVVLTATGCTIKKLEDILATASSRGYKGFPVVMDTKDYLLVGYISEYELRYALRQARTVALLTDNAECYLGGVLPPSSDEFSADLREWVDRTPITLSHRSSLQLAVSAFQKLGLRYVLFTMKGRLQGMLTKNDICGLNVID
ncbi:chloride channel [Limtongia smithiae]|uniref:chloride channel n=1 Tax=Limtongia smithiae TaxID=1125753 RepID=UPI0034CD84BC